VHALDVIGEPIRRRILELLRDGELPAGEITDAIQRDYGVTQPAVSQHLRVLRDNGLVTVRPVGARRLYAVSGERLRDVDLWVNQFRVFWTGPLDALATEVARGKRTTRQTARRDGNTTRRRRSS
jgi:DNA-binding transcriptional ArsR family regulator